MEKSKIGVDIDGVLADFTGEFIKLSREMFGLPVEGYVQTKWNFEDSGLSTKDIEAVWTRIRGTKNFWLGLSRLAGTNRLGDLCEENEVTFITTRPEVSGLSTYLQSVLWLESRFNLRRPQVVVSNQKGLVVLALGIQWMIDDKPENLQNILETGCKTELRLQDAPYNQECKSFRRVNSINEFYQEIRNRGN